MPLCTAGETVDVCACVRRLGVPIGVRWIDGQWGSMISSQVATAGL